jgi:DNA-binding transcriptional LysR family regulator
LGAWLSVVGVGVRSVLALAVRSGMGIGVLPDWMNDDLDGLTRLLPDLKAPKVEVYFVYPEELRNSKRVAVFRDFLLARLRLAADPAGEAR